MEKQSAHEGSFLPEWTRLAAPLPRSYLRFVGQVLLGLAETVRGLGAFSLITLGVTITKWRLSAQVIHPLIRAQINRAGVKLLPIVAFMAFALGFVVIGQMVSLLNKVGAQNYVGVVMVMVVVRELGPIVTALLVLAKVGTATVIELGNARATGQVEALEALGIDPIHYLVVPRVLGLSLAIFSLTVYLIIISMISGYLFVFLQDVALLPGAYIDQLAAALRWEDFALLALKTFFFGAIIATVTCYEGLAKPLEPEDVSLATTQAVVQSVELCVLLDACFILYLLIIK